MIQEYKDFWSKYEPYKLHPTDDEALSKLSIEQRNKLVTNLSPQVLKKKYIDLDDLEKNKEFHNDLEVSRRAIHSNMYCKPFTGNPETAKVFFLYGNPGLDLRDYKNEHYDTEFRERLDNELRFNSTGFLYLNESFKRTNSFDYWNSNGRLTTLIYELSRRKPCSLEDARVILSESLCLLQSIGYHSRNTPYKKLETIPSSIFQRELVHNYLLPKALRKEIFIFSWRATRFWGLESFANQDEPNIMIRDSNKARIGSFLRKTHFEADRIVKFLLSKIG